MSNDFKGRQALLKRLEALNTPAVGFEASGGQEKALLKCLIAAGVTAHRLNPRRVRDFAKAMGYLAKTDKVDAKVIAEFVAVSRPQETTINASADALSELMDSRKAKVDQKIEAKSRLERAENPLVTRQAQAEIELIVAHIDEIDAEMAKIIDQDKDLRTKAQILQSVPGVGKVVATALLAYLPELGEAPNRQIASLVGVAPIANDSGARRGHRHIKGGRKELRDIVYMAALVAKRYNTILKAFAKRLADKQKKPKVVVIAVLRKLVVTLNAILKTGELWNPNQMQGANLG